MDGITIRDTHDFSEQELEDLFLSVGWSSGNFPDRLRKAMHGFETVFSAWDDDLLVGMICAMDDHSMTAYIHYLLVSPEYQDHGIGHALVERVREHYADYLRIVVVAYDNECAFYEDCGFEQAHGSSPMYITSLWT